MLLSRNLDALRDLGVPEEFLTQQEEVLEDAMGMIHSAHTFCSLPSNGFEPEVVRTYLSLEELSPATECTCVGSQGSAGDNAWGVFFLVLSATELLPEVLETMSPPALTHMYRKVGRHECHLVCVAARARADGHAALEEVVTSAQERVRQSQERTLSLLKAAHAQIAHVLPSRRYAVGLHGFALSHYYRPGSIDALLLAAGQEKDDSYAGVLSEAQVGPVQLWTNQLCSEVDPEIARAYFVPLVESDTPAVVETALSLWDPSHETDLRDLHQAFTAARRLCRH